MKKILDDFSPKQALALSQDFIIIITIIENFIFFWQYKLQEGGKF